MSAANGCHEGVFPPKESRDAAAAALKALAKYRAMSDRLSDDPIIGGLPNRLRGLACPAGEPWTGDTPSGDHGHTDCWLIHQAADELEDSRRRLAAIRALPDVRHHNGYPDSIYYGAGYNAAMRQVKALLDGES